MTEPWRPTHRTHRLDDSTRPDPAVRHKPERNLTDRSYGTQPMSSIGRTAAIIVGITLVAAVVILAMNVGVIDQRPEISLDEVSESLVDPGDGACRWIVEFQLVNRADVTLKISSIRTSVRLHNWPGINPGGTDAHLISTRLRPSESVSGRIEVDVPVCPESLKALKHDPIFITYVDDSLRRGLAALKF